MAVKRVCVCIVMLYLLFQLHCETFEDRYIVPVNIISAVKLEIWRLSLLKALMTSKSSKCSVSCRICVCFRAHDWTGIQRWRSLPYMPRSSWTHDEPVAKISVRQSRLRCCSSADRSVLLCGWHDDGCLTLQRLILYLFLATTGAAFRLVRAWVQWSNICPLCDKHTSLWHADCLHAFGILSTHISLKLPRTYKWQCLWQTVISDIFNKSQNHLPYIVDPSKLQACVLPYLLMQLWH